MADTLTLLNAARLAFYDNRPTADLIATATQNILTGTGTDTAVIFGSAGVDNWSGWSAGSPTRYTAQVAGVYQVSGLVSWPSAASSRAVTKLTVNGTVVAGSQGEVGFLASFSVTCPSPVIEVSLNVGDYVQMVCNQGSGGTLTLPAGNQCSSLSVQYIRSQ